MAQRKIAATPVRQHWSYHNSTPIHQHKNGKMTTDAQSNLGTHIDGPAQDCSNSSASALELPLFRTKTPIWTWQQTCRPTLDYDVLILMAQCKTAATPVHQHWNHHISTPSHRHEHGNKCIKQLAYWHWWHSARLQQLQCISTGATTVPRQAINMTMITCQHMYKTTCVLTLMAQCKTNMITPGPSCGKIVFLA